MRLTFRLFVAILILGATFAAGRSTDAQAPVPPPAQSQAPTVISGGDIGFRVDAQKGNTPVGRLVVRINGQWIEPAFATGPQRLTARECEDSLPVVRAAQGLTG
jgi:hypothetical protein